jgi:hypothetical protein
MLQKSYVDANQYYNLLHSLHMTIRNVSHIHNTMDLGWQLWPGKFFADEGSDKEGRETSKRK